MSKSPFPGMDPYLEECWRDVHHKLCTYACDDIQAQLGAGLHARVDERLVVELPTEAERSIYPDVRVVEKPGRSAWRPVQPAAGLALAEPLTVDIADEPYEEGFIQIVDTRTGGKVITVVEFLSVSNKFPGKTHEQYLKKREELWDAHVSLA